MALARVERCAAQSIEPLIAKYHLHPRDKLVLQEEGESHVSAHASLTWKELMAHMIEFYPTYLDEFDELERSALDVDKLAPQKLTQHEVAAIDFVKAELANDSGSLMPLEKYIDQFNSQTA